MQQLTVDAGSSEAKVRRQALRALRERGGPEALALLGRLVGDPEVDIREDAIEAVIGLYVHPPAKRSMKNAEDAFRFAPSRTTPYPVPAELSTALVKALADDYESVRRDAAYAVGITMTPPVPNPVAFELVASLSDKFPAVRIAAAQVLGRLRVLSAGVHFIGRINDEALDVRLAAMRAVGDVRDLRAVAALTEQFEFYVRGVAGRAAIDALARIADKQSRALFEAQTDSGYPAHRRSAYEGLGRVGNLGQAVPRIEAALMSEKSRPGGDGVRAHQRRPPGARTHLRRARRSGHGGPGPRVTGRGRSEECQGNRGPLAGSGPDRARAGRDRARLHRRPGSGRSPERGGERQQCRRAIGGFSGSAANQAGGQQGERQLNARAEATTRHRASGSPVHQRSFCARTTSPVGRSPGLACVLERESPEDRPPDDVVEHADPAEAPGKRTG